MYILSRLPSVVGTWLTHLGGDTFFFVHNNTHFFVCFSSSSIRCGGYVLLWIQVRAYSGLPSRDLSERTEQAAGAPAQQAAASHVKLCSIQLFV